MAVINFITKKQKNKHSNISHYEYIISCVSKHYLENKGKIRNTGRTSLIFNLAKELGISKSTIYTIINDSKITVMTSNLVHKNEMSASAAFSKRSKRRFSSNNRKVEKSKAFTDLVCKEVKENKLASIDETINDLILNRSNEIINYTTICTKTFYNYVHAGLVPLKPIDLPRTVQRKKSINYKTYLNKRQKGVSITERPFLPEDRSIFGHWEGDLVTGPRDGQSGALLTLIERKTRMYYTIPITTKSSKQVYMAINKLHKLFGDNFSKIFKSITFDNGSEFSRYKDIEFKPGSKIKRTTVYFARPYRSCDRGSNEAANQLVRYFIKKGTDINTISHQFILNMNQLINNKKRRLHGYKSSISLFIKELNLINVSNQLNLYL